MVACTIDKALVAKHPPENPDEHPATTAAKHPPTNTIATHPSTNTAAKHPPRRRPACSLQQSIYQRGDQRHNGGKAFTRNSIGGQASAKEEANTPITAKHLSERRPMTT